MNWTRVAVASIVAVGIGASAFLALRSDDRPPAPTPPDSRSRPEGPPAPGPTPVRPAPPAAGAPSPAPPDPAKRPDGADPASRREAESEVARIRDKLLASCEGELRAAQPPLSFRVRLVFDAQGREIIRSVTADQKSPQAIANCLSRVAAGTLRIPPTGKTVTTVVPLSIP
jgi:hypothetical protein